MLKIVSSCRKWLTNPVRKLSQGRLDKGDKPTPDPGGQTASRAGKATKFQPFKVFCYLIILYTMYKYSQYTAEHSDTFSALVLSDE